MRKPHTASAQRRSRTRLAKRGPGKRISRGARGSSSRRLFQAPLALAEPAPEPPQGGQQSSGANEDGALVPPEVGKSTRGGFAWGELARAQEEEKRGTPAVEMTQREPLRCGFGAVRVGALLGRLRLHLQTDRFLAVHRGDGVWESACVAAARTLAEIVETMSEAALDAPLAPDGTERGAR